MELRVRPGDGVIIFGDLIGKLDVLCVEYAKCGRSGHYRVADLISPYGRDEKLFALIRLPRGGTHATAVNHGTSAAFSRRAHYSGSKRQYASNNFL